MTLVRSGLLSAVLLCLAALAANAQIASLLPNGEQQFVDQNGQPYAAGSVYFYIPSTTTPKTTWANPTESTPNANPVVLDAAGRAIIYGSGQYRQVLKDVFGNTIWDQLTAAQVLGTAAGENLNSDVIDNGAGSLTYAGPITVVTAATTTDLGANASPQLVIAGTTTITSLGSSAAIGQLKFVEFSGVLTLTYNATSLVLPGGANITTAAGDTAVFRYEGAGNWRALFYTRASGQALAQAASSPLGIVSGLVATGGQDSSGNSQISYSIGEITVKTGLAGTAYLGANLGLLFNCAVTGAGGMDTGTCPTTGQVNVYLITKGDGTTWGALGWSGASTATVTGTVSGGVVTGTSGLSGGLGYSRPPVVFASAETGCSKLPTFGSTVAGGTVTGITIQNNGVSGCSAVTIQVSPPDCEVYWGGALPAGYLAMALLGSYPMTTGPAFNFPAGGPLGTPLPVGYFTQRGRTVSFVDEAVLTNGSSGSFAAVSLAGLVPGNANAVGGNANGESDSSSSQQGATFVLAASPSAVGEIKFGGLAQNGAGNVGELLFYSPFAKIPLVVPRTLYYQVTGLPSASAAAMSASINSYTFGELEP